MYLSVILRERKFNKLKIIKIIHENHWERNTKQLV